MKNYNQTNSFNLKVTPKYGHMVAPYFIVNSSSSKYTDAEKEVSEIFKQTRLYQLGYYYDIEKI